MISVLRPEDAEETFSGALVPFPAEDPDESSVFFLANDTFCAAGGAVWTLGEYDRSSADGVDGAIRASGETDSPPLKNVDGADSASEENDRSPLNDVAGAVRLDVDEEAFCPVETPVCLFGSYVTFSVLRPDGAGIVLFAPAADASADAFAPHFVQNFIPGFSFAPQDPQRWTVSSFEPHSPQKTSSSWSVRKLQFGHCFMGIVLSSEEKYKKEYVYLAYYTAENTKCK